MLKIGTHVKVQRVSHTGRRSKTLYYKQGKILAYYEYGKFYLVDFKIYKECYKECELLEVRE